MKATYIDYSETNSFSPQIIRYLSKDSQLEPFISYEPTIDGFGKIIDRKEVCCNREVLVSVLKEQYSNTLNLDDEQLRLVKQNIESLARDNSFTITTGHQLNIFTGPLYFIFKIVTAINLAVELKASFPDKNFIPVYWMATEDHDFAEIDHTSLSGKKIQWKNDAAGATGRLSTESMLEVLKNYQGILGISKNAEKLSLIVHEAYKDHSNLADATRFLVNALFENYGLVVIDADDKRLKQQFSNIIEKDILEQNSFREISDSSKKLEEIGFETQVNAREINFFYLLDGFRERITFENGTYYILNSEIKFTPQELTKEIRSNPERFSPNVVLRPLYQEVILPNLAYIGGGAEIVYWLQLKKNFDFYKIDFPILILRNSAMLADETIEAKLQRLDLQFKDIFTNSDELKKDWILKHTKHELNIDDEKKELELVFEKIKIRAHKIDPTLSPSSEAVKARLYKQLDNLEKKMIKAEKGNYSTALSQIDIIREKLVPNGGLQERSENFGLFYVKYGNKLIAELVEHFKPLDFKFTILS